MTDASDARAGRRNAGMTSRFRFNLPPHEQLLLPRQRWYWMHKRDIVVAIGAGIVSFDEVKQAHNLPSEELARWVELYRPDGDSELRQSAPGLRRARAA